MVQNLYDQSELVTKPEIAESLRLCALYIAAWATAAIIVVGWKQLVRPGGTQQIGAKLWDVLLTAWGNPDKDNVAVWPSLLEHHSPLPDRTVSWSPATQTQKCWALPWPL